MKFLQLLFVSEKRERVNPLDLYKISANCKLNATLCEILKYSPMLSNFDL